MYICQGVFGRALSLPNNAAVDKGRPLRKLETTVFDLFIFFYCGIVAACV